MPLASSTLVSLVYKASVGIAVSLELMTTDASQCTYVDVQEVKRKFLKETRKKVVYSVLVLTC